MQRRLTLPSHHFEVRRKNKMEWYEVAAELNEKIVSGDTESAIERISQELRELPDSPFHVALTLGFTNTPEQVADHFDRFLIDQRFEVKAVYTETNGFDINPDRWFFDVFAFQSYGGSEDLDWLCEWDSGSSPDMTLTGMEELQKVYDSEAFENDEFSKAGEFSSLLVVSKFQDLIRRSIPHMKKLESPLLATSHDYDFIAEFKK